MKSINQIVSEINVNGGEVTIETIMEQGQLLQQLVEDNHDAVTSLLYQLTEPIIKKCFDTYAEAIEKDTYFWKKPDEFDAILVQIHQELLVALLTERVEAYHDK